MLGDEKTLMVKAHTKEILENSEIKGVCWLDVLDKCGERYEDTFQLTAEAVIPTEALILHETEYRKKNMLRNLWQRAIFNRVGFPAESAEKCLGSGN